GDQPDDLVFELAQQATFPDHPLGRPILGVENTVRSIQRDDLVRFPSQHYAANRTIVTVAGAFDRQAIIDLVSAWFEKSGGGQRPQYAPPVIGAPSVRTAARKLEQTHLVLARRTVDAMSDDRFAARIFAEIFGGGMASRLFQEVRESRGLAYTIDASCDQYSDAGRISVYAGCAPVDAAEVVKLTQGIWSDLAANGPTEAELARAKAIAAAQFAMAAEAPAARAGTAGYELLTFGKLVSVEDVLARIGAVTIAEVRKIAADTYRKPGIASAVGPKAGLAAAEAFVSAPG
ncbi:MAG TPA: pitrilysin family protein, partial [Hyphomonadaceae bacterium]|nr:pitrilysin family protein [Hyphomonadaceae bacterium]